MEETFLVYVDLAGVPIKVGELWSRYRQGRESMSFEYDRSWLHHPQRFSLDATYSYLQALFMHHTKSLFLEPWMIQP